MQIYMRMRQNPHQNLYQYPNEIPNPNLNRIKTENENDYQNHTKST